MATGHCEQMAYGHGPEFLGNIAWVPFPRKKSDHGIVYFETALGYRNPYGGRSKALAQ